MDDTGLPEEERLSSSGTLRARHLAIIAAVALAAVLGYYWWSTREPAPAGPPPAGPVAVPEGSRTVTLFFAREDEPSLFGETRQVAMGRALVDQVTQVVRALVAGPAREGANTIPEGTRLLGVFFDEAAFTVYLDFSGELVAAHPGGASAEYSTVLAIVKTVSENFPEVQAVQILVDGFQVGTIAGHVDAYGPFYTRDWR